MAERASDGKETGRLDAVRLLLILALLLTSLGYSSTLRFQFVSDDIPHIVNNPGGHTWQVVPRLFLENVWSQFGGQAGNYYRPIAELWLVFNYSLFGLHPLGWHLTTLLVHLAVTMMLYVLARRVTGDRLTAAIATVIFGVHPAHIEAVAWISAVTDPLLSIFIIGSILSYARSREAQGRIGMGWRAISLITYALAMLCKETGIVVPGLLFLYDFFIDRRHVRDTLLSLGRRYAPYAVEGGLYLALRHFVLRGIAYAEPKPWLDVFLTLPSFLWFYVHELIWPFGLSLFHETPLVHSPGLKNFVLPLAGVTAFTGILFWVAKRSKSAAFGSWWLLILMLPPLAGIYTFIPADLVHDRYLYLPIAGFAMVLAWIIRKTGPEEQLPRTLFQAPLVITLILGGGLAAATPRQTLYWADDLVLYTHTVQAAPNNVLAIDHLANEIYKRGDRKGAIALYERAAQLEPRDWATRLALGVMLFEEQRFPEAQRELEVATSIRPEFANQYYYLGLTHLQQRHFPDAEQQFRRAIQIYSQEPGFHYALAMALEGEGRLGEASDELREEWKINPAPQVKQALDRLQSIMPSH